MNELDSQKNSINRQLLIALGLFLIVIFVIITVLWPGFRQFQILQKEIEMKKEAVQAEEEYILDLMNLEARLAEEYKEDLVRIDSALPDKKAHASAIPSLYNYLRNAAAGSGLVLVDIRPFNTSASARFPLLQETVFNIKLAGSYSSLKSFLETLERSLRLIQIENISFPASEEGVFTFSLSLKVYSYGN